MTYEAELFDCINIVFNIITTDDRRNPKLSVWSFNFLYDINDIP